MKYTFLARLYRYSKTAFILVVIFILSYSFLFLKQMDMTVFAYNAMFTSARKPEKIHVYAIKLDEKLLTTTKYFWWKKDFLESSIDAYATYYKEGQKSYLDGYIHQKISDSAIRRTLLGALTSGKISPEQWAKHYISFLGERPKRGQSFEIVQYELSFLSSKVIIGDSVSIYKSRLL